MLLLLLLLLGKLLKKKYVVFNFNGTIAELKGEKDDTEILLLNMFFKNRNSEYLFYYVYDGIYDYIYIYIYIYPLINILIVMIYIVYIHITHSVIDFFRNKGCNIMIVIIFL